LTVHGVLLLGLAATPPHAQTPDAGAVLDRAVAAHQAARTLRADFTMTSGDPLVGTEETSRGEYLQQRPRFAIRWRQPAGDLIVSDGATLWVYLPSTQPGQVVRQTLSDRPGESGDFLAQFLDRPRERFTIGYVRAESVGSRPADVVELTAKDRNQALRRVLIWVDRGDGLVLRFEATDAAGATRRVTLDRVRVNATLPGSAFAFRPPAGARVVDATP
jgi:outer membrane lipoprotein carrier protein